MDPLHSLAGLTPNQTVAAGDEMVYPGAEDSYFSIGRRALELLVLAQHLCQRSNYINVLDLPCGHGRVMRWIRAQYPHAHITGCDLNRDGVDFCCEQFGAVPVYSEPDLRAVAFERAFDLVWCGSLLTHLPVPVALQTLDALISCASEDAVIVFTTQGRYLSSVLARGEGDFADNVDVVSLLEDYRREGAAFQPYYEDPAGRYGLSLLAPTFLTAVLERNPHVIIRAYLEQAWGVQDVVVLYKKSGYYASLR